jgi:hypothetical protein
MPGTPASSGKNSSPYTSLTDVLPNVLSAGQVPIVTSRNEFCVLSVSKR